MRSDLRDLGVLTAWTAAAVLVAAVVGASIFAIMGFTMAYGINLLAGHPEAFSTIYMVQGSAVLGFVWGGGTMLNELSDRWTSFKDQMLSC